MSPVGVGQVFSRPVGSHTSRCIQLGLSRVCATSYFSLGSVRPVGSHASVCDQLVLN